MRAGNNFKENLKEALDNAYWYMKATLLLQQEDLQSISAAKTEVEERQNDDEALKKYYETCLSIYSAEFKRILPSDHILKLSMDFAAQNFQEAFQPQVFQTGHAHTGSKKKVLGLKDRQNVLKTEHVFFSDLPADHQESRKEAIKRVFDDLAKEKSKPFLQRLLNPGLLKKARENYLSVAFPNPADRKEALDAIKGQRPLSSKGRRR